MNPKVIKWSHFGLVISAQSSLLQSGISETLRLQLPEFPLCMTKEILVLLYLNWEKLISDWSISNKSKYRISVSPIQLPVELPRSTPQTSLPCLWGCQLQLLAKCQKQRKLDHSTWKLIAALRVFSFKIYVNVYI